MSYVLLCLVYWEIFDIFPLLCCIFTMNLDLMLIFWPLGTQKRLFLPISNDLNPVNLFFYALCQLFAFGDEAFQILLVRRIEAIYFIWFSLLYDFVAFLCIFSCEFLLLCYSFLVVITHLCINHISMFIFPSYHDLSNQIIPSRIFACQYVCT